MYLSIYLLRLFVKQKRIKANSRRVGLRFVRELEQGKKTLRLDKMMGYWLCLEKKFGLLIIYENNGTKSKNIFSRSIGGCFNRG